MKPRGEEQSQLSLETFEIEYYYQKISYFFFKGKNPNDCNRLKLYRDSFNLVKKECFADLLIQHFFRLKCLEQKFHTHKFKAGLFFLFMKNILLCNKNLIKKNFILSF